MQIPGQWGVLAGFQLGGGGGGGGVCHHGVGTLARIPFWKSG